MSASSSRYSLRTRSQRQRDDESQSQQTSTDVVQTRSSSRRSRSQRQQRDLGKLVFTWRQAPLSRPVLPAVIDQRDREICQCVAIIEGMESVMAIRAAKKNLPPPPKLSLQQLVDVQKTIPVRQRFLSNLMEWVTKNGVFEESAYSRWGSNAIQHANQYKFFWWDYFDPEEQGFEGKVKLYLRGRGPIIAEFPMHVSYDESGKLQLRYRATGRPRRVIYSSKRGDGDQEGHAVLITGWGENGECFWEYMNSYGVEFGRDGGFGELLSNKLHWGFGIGPVHAIAPVNDPDEIASE